MEYLDWAARNPILAVIMLAFVCAAVGSLGNIGTTRIGKRESNVTKNSYNEHSVDVEDDQ